MGTVEHYVLINGKIICELVGEYEVHVPQTSASVSAILGSNSAVEFHKRALRNVPLPPETKEKGLSSLDTGGVRDTAGTVTSRCDRVPTS
jgi:hypothetical protein